MSIVVRQTEALQAGSGGPSLAGAFVAVLGTRVPGCWHVSIDNAQGATTAVRHLINLGHRRIGMITGALGDPRGFTTPIVREHAYRSVLAEAGIPYEPDLEAPGNFGIEEGAVLRKNGMNDQADEAGKVLGKLMGSPPSSLAHPRASTR